ncbi:MAG: PAS domain-containing protein [Candidatus Pacebacteria bacterium]|nr:PAS domain-containing protein [Candidatus Paceibacterota bacterium]
MFELCELNKKGIAERKMKDDLKKIMKGDVINVKERGTLFQIMFYHIMQYNRLGIVVYSILLVAEMYQHVSPAVIVMTSNANSVDFVLKVMNYVNFPRRVLEVESFALFFGVWLIDTIVVWTAVICALFLGLLYPKPIRQVTPVSRALGEIASVLCVILNTVLAIPTTELNVVPMVCTGTSHQYISDLKCGSANHVVICVISALTLSVHVASQFCFSQFYLDAHVSSELPWAGEGADVNAFRLALRLAVGLMISVDYNMDLGVTALCVYAVIFLLYFHRRLHRSGIYNALVLTMMYIVDIFALLMLMVTIYNNALGQKVLVAHYLVCNVLAIVSGICITFWQQSSRMRMLAGGTDRHLSPNDSIDYLSALAELPSEIRGKRQAEFVLHATLVSHREKCEDVSCICKENFYQNYDYLSRTNKQLAQSSKVDSSLTIASNVAEKWYQFIAMLLDRAIQRFPYSAQLRLYASYFEEIRMKNYYKAFFMVQKAQECRLTMVDGNYLYRAKLHLSRSIIVAESKSTTAVNSNTSIGNIMKFEKWTTRLEKLIVYASLRVIEFWKNLQTVHINVNDLYSLGNRITRVFKLAHTAFNKIINVYPNHARTYVNYGLFLKDVMNDDLESGILIRKGEFYEKNYLLSYHKMANEESMFDLNSRTVVITILGSLSRLGTVKHVNEHVKEMLGYTPGDLVGHNITRIMPRNIGEHHDSFMLRFFNNGNAYLMEQSRLMLAQSKEGFIVPISLLVKSCPGLEEGIQYIGFIRSSMTEIRAKLLNLPFHYQRSKVAFILADNNANVIGISEKACRTFGITTKYFMRKKCFSNEIINMRKFNPAILLPDTEAKLTTEGAEIYIDTRCLLEYVDKDYLKQSEQQRLEKAVRNMKVFMMMKRMEFSEEVVLNCYYFVVIASFDGIHAKLASFVALRDIMSPRTVALKAAQGGGMDVASQASVQSADTRGLFERLNLGMMSGDTSSVGSNKVFVRDFKKKILENKRPFIITRLLIAIVSLCVVLVVIVTAEFALYVNKMKDFSLLNEILVLSYERITYYNMMISASLDVANIANGLELDKTDYTYPNRLSQIYYSYNTVAYGMQHKEFEYFDLFWMNGLGDLYNKFQSDNLEVSILYNNYTISKSAYPPTLFFTYSYKMFLELMAANVSDVGSEAYLSNFQSGTLSSLDLNMFFLMVNSIGKCHVSFADISQKLWEYVQDQIHNHQVLHIVLQTIMYFVIVASGGIFILFVVRIQRSKRSVLVFFAEIPKSRLKEIETLTRQFVDKFTLNVSDPNNLPPADSKPTSNFQPTPVDGGTIATGGQTTSSVTAGNGGDATRKGSPLSDLNDPTPANDPAVGQTPRLLKLQTMKELDSLEEKEPGPGEVEDDRALLQKEEEEELVRKKTETAKKSTEEFDKVFAAKRKERMLKYKVSLGYITLLLIAVLLVIAGYLAKNLYFYYRNTAAVGSNIEAAVPIYKRSKYVSTLLLFFRATLKGLQRFYATEYGSDPIGFYFKLFYDNEELLTKFEVSPPSDLQPLADTLTQWDSKEFCSGLHALVNTMNMTICIGILDGALNEGLTRSLALVTSYVRDKQAEFEYATDSDAKKSAIMLENKYTDMIQMFEAVFYPVNGQLFTMSHNQFEKVLAKNNEWIYADYAILIALIIVSLILLLKVFIRTLEGEIWKARGILNLLPKELLRKKEIRDVLASNDSAFH